MLDEEFDELYTTNLIATICTPFNIYIYIYYAKCEIVDRTNVARLEKSAIAFA